MNHAAILTAVLLTAVAHGEEWPPGYTEAYKAAKEGERPLVLLLSTSWCRWCPEARRVLREAGVEHVHIDVDRYPQFARLAVRGVPQLLIYTERMTRLTRCVGLDAIRRIR